MGYCKNCGQFSWRDDPVQCRCLPVGRAWIPELGEEETDACEVWSRSTEARDIATEWFEHKFKDDSEWMMGDGDSTDVMLRLSDGRLFKANVYVSWSRSFFENETEEIEPATPMIFEEPAE